MGGPRNRFSVHELRVYLYGYRAAERAFITCLSGDTCYIYCKYSGCFDTNLICESGSQCIVEPTACNNDHTLKKSESTDCPNWIDENDDSEDDMEFNYVFERDDSGSLIYSVGNHFVNKYYLFIAIFVT